MQLQLFDTTFPVSNQIQQNPGICKALRVLGLRFLVHVPKGQSQILSTATNYKSQVGGSQSRESGM